MRLRSVTPKPGFVFDGANVVPFKAQDGLINVLSGRGTTIDRSTQTFWHYQPMPPQQIEAAYRSSWLVSKIVDLPAMDMMREWREWEGEPEQVEVIEAAEKRLKLHDAILSGLIYGRMGGGAVILGGADMAQEWRPGEELLYAVAVPHMRLQLGDIDWNPQSPRFGEPREYRLTSNGGSDIIHPSRLLIFKGERVPGMTGVSSTQMFWGDSIVERVDRAIKDAQAVTEGFAGLVEEAKIDIMRISGMADRLMQPGGDDKMRQRFEATQLGKSNYRGIYLDKEDEWDQRQITWSGMPDMMRSYLSIVAGAADIPATRLLGKAPDGQNATGEHDERNYRAMIVSRQQMVLRPMLEQVDTILLASLNISDDLSWSFSPLDTPDEKTQAEIAERKAKTAQIYADSGLIPMGALETGVQNRLIEDGTYPGLGQALEEAEAAAPDDDDLGIVPVPANDAAPRTLYVQRKLLNAAEVIRWAKSQGFKTTLSADDMHITVAFSRTPLDWMKVEPIWDHDEAGLKVAPGGARLVEPLGDQDAVVLMFTSSTLAYRHEAIKHGGASWDYPEYQPHVTLTYDPGDVDLSQVEPFRGELSFGPEIWQELDENWKSGVVEK